MIDGIGYTVPNGKHMRMWGIKDIHTGVGTGTYIAAAGDFTYDPMTGERRIVVDVDSVTGIAKLENVVESECNKMLMVYYDPNTVPNTVSVDGTFTVTGDVGYAIAYKSSNLNDSISEIYDSMGDFDTDRIPVRRVNSNSHEPLSVYNIDRFHTSETLVNGDYIKLDVFDVYGTLTASRFFLVSDVGPLNDATHTGLVIRSVDLVTPFMDDGDVIRRPITITVDDLNLAVRVEYTSGEERIYGLDHERVELAGMDIVSLNNTSITHDIMVIFKTMGDPVNGPLASNGIITVPYHLFNYTPSLSYNHTLQVYPMYISHSEGYRMAARLTLADRSAIVDVSNLVEYTTYVDDENITIDGIHGTGMGILQHVTAVLDLRRVHTLPETHTLTKKTWLTLNNNGGIAGPAWDINGPLKCHKPLSTYSAVGVTTLQLTDDPEAWWDNAYASTEPMIISGLEVDAPLATHIVVYGTLDGDKILHKSEVDTFLKFVELEVNDIIHIHFIQLLGSKKIILSHIPLLI